MAVWLSMWLFGKPGQELREGEDVSPEELRALAADMQGRLTLAADVVEKLTGSGWSAHMALYDVHFTHPYINSQVQAEEHLLKLGIDPDVVFIDEFEDEEEEYEEFAEGEEGEEENGEGDEEQLT
jgi:hypothetical protein